MNLHEIDLSLLLNPYREFMLFLTCFLQFNTIVWWVNSRTWCSMFGQSGKFFINFKPSFSGIHGLCWPSCTYEYFMFSSSTFILLYEGPICIWNLCNDSSFTRYVLYSGCNLDCPFYVYSEEKPVLQNFFQVLWFRNLGIIFDKIFQFFDVLKPMSGNRAQACFPIKKFKLYK